MTHGIQDDPSGLDQRVGAIVASVIHDDELDWVRLDRSGGGAVARLSAQGELLSFPLVAPGTELRWQLEHFAAALEDFVSESRFGWGQQRTVPTALYELPDPAEP